MEWWALKDLAKVRGFGDIVGRCVSLAGHELYGVTKRIGFKLVSGLTNDQAHGLLGEIREGGWTGTQTSRKRHFFRKMGSIFSNPSLCGKHHLKFHTTLDRDDLGP